MFASSSFSMPRGGQWDLNAMLKTSGITGEVQQHLLRVYSTLSACVFSCALGVALAMRFGGDLYSRSSGWSGFVTLIWTTGAVIWLTATPVHEFTKRFAILMSIAASVGFSISSLVEVALLVDPSLLLTAFLMTTTVFLCFTGTAMFAKRREYLYLGGLLSSALSTMALMNLLNMFFRSTLLYSVHLYGGLAMFCGYVIFDTQMIIEKVHMGDKDFLKHTLELFLDFVSIFMRILVILLQNAEKKDSKKSKERRQ